MYNVYITNYKSGNSVITSWTKIFGVPANDDNGFPMVSPSVKDSEDNAASFDFSMEMNSPYYDAFMHLKTLIAVEYDGDYIFFGRVLTIDNSTVYQTKRVHCEGAFGFMNDTHYEGVTEKDKQKISWSTYYDRIINNHNTMVQTRSPEKEILRGTVTIDGSTTFVPTTEERKYEPSNWTQTGSLISSLVSEFGGHAVVRYRSGRNYLDWYKYYARDLGVNRPTVSVGENIIDISTSANNVDKIFTWVTPMGDSGNDGKPIYLEGFTYTDKNGVSHTINSKHIPVSIVRDVYTDNQLNDEFHSASDYSNAFDNYGDIYKPQTFASAKTQQELWNYTIKWIKECYFGIASSFTVRAYDMHVLDSSMPKILVGDCVNVQYVIMENGSRTVKTKKLVCKSASYDLFYPDNNSYTFGIPSEILNRSYSEGRGKSGSEQPSGGGGGGGGSDDKDIELTFDGIAKWIQAAAGESEIYGGNIAAQSFIDNGEVTGTAKVYDPADLPQGETIDQHKDLVFNANIAGRITATGRNIYVATNPTRGLFAFIGGRPTNTVGALPITFWYYRNKKKQITNYTPPSMMYTEEEEELIHILEDWGIDIQNRDDLNEKVNNFYIGLNDNIKGLKTQIWDPVSQKVVEPFKAVIGGLGEIGESIFGFLGLSGGNSKVRVSDDGTEDGTNGVELLSNLLTYGTYLNDFLHPKVQLDGGSSQVKAGFDQNGNWNSVMNATITWVDEHGVEHTTDGFMKAKDFAVREVPSFKTKFIAVDQLVADKATIGELNAVTVRVENLESDTIKTNELSARIANLTKLRTNAIEATNGIVGNYLMAPYIYLGSLGNANLINGAIKEVQVVPVDNTSEYVLQYRTFDNNTWQDAGTFERAASGDAKVRVTWSGGTLHVVPDVVGDDNYVRWFQKNEEDITWDTNYAWVNVPVNALDEQDRVREANVFSVYIPTTDAVNHGKQAVKLAGTWNAADNRLTITKESSGSNSLSYDISAVANITYSSATHKYHAIAQAKVDDVIHGEADGLDSGTEAWDDGRSSVKLAGAWNAADNRLTITKETSGSNSLSYDISALAAITYNSTTHKYHATAQAKVDNAVHGDADGLDSGTEAWDAGVTSGKNAGYNSAKMSGSWNSNNDTLTITKNTNGSTSLSYALSAKASITYNSSTHKYRASAQAKVDGTVRGAADGVDSGTEAYDDGVTNGKNAVGLSIDTRNSKIKLNKSSASITEVLIALGLGSLSGTAGTYNRSRTVSVTANGTTLLSNVISDYKTGWDACKGKVTAGVSTPTWDSTSKKFNAYGYAYVDGTLQKTSSAGSSSALSLDTGSLSGTDGTYNRSRTVKVKHGSTEILSSAIGDYKTGWDACKGKVTAGVSTPTWDSTSKKFNAYGYAYVDGTLQKTSSAGSSSALSLDTGSLSNGSRTIKVKHGTTEILSSTISDYNSGVNAIWANVGITYGETDNECSGYYTNAEAKLIFNAGVTAPGKDTKWMGTNYFGAEAKNIYKKGFAAGWQAALSGSSSYWWVGEVEEGGVHYWEAWTPKASAYSACNGSGQGSSYGEQWAASRVRYYNHGIALRQQNGYAGASKMVMYFKDNNGNYQPAAGGSSMAWYYSATSLGWTGSYHTFGYYS